MIDAPKRKLIEVALPLEAINRESAREKSIRHGHPSTLHLWWSRKPTAAARAVLFAQLVDDPSAHPDTFPTEELQRAERQRLHELIERLVVWENVRDDTLLAQARWEILASTGGNPPPIVDPFAGGGTIPLEAQRLGLEARASDLNPVAVLINKALIEIPPTFAGRPPVFPGLADTRAAWPGATGLAADVRAYGEWMRDQALQRIGHLYPNATLPDGATATVIAWIWARTVTCPNPTCRIDTPLTSKWWLGKKKGKEAYITPTITPDPTHPSGKTITYTIGHDPATAPTAPTVDRTGATCVACHAGVPLAHIRAEGRAGRMGSALMAIVAEGNRQRVYLPPDPLHAAVADVPTPPLAPDELLATHPQYMAAPRYGLTRFSDLFTPRQLFALTTFSDLVGEARYLAIGHAVSAGLPDGDPLADGGRGARAYADAVATYLGLGVSRMTDIANALCRWENTKEQVRNLFGRQAIPMLWDFAETQPFGSAAGAFTVSLGNLIKTIHVASRTPGEARQANAAEVDYASSLLSSDPPYYDNIPYSDLSDFFYVWLRRSLSDVHPGLFGTVLTPKSAELVADYQRHQGKEGAKRFFEDGFRQVFARAREAALEDFPITVYYAYKQSDTSDEGTTSSGWETLLEGMIRSGWLITATWPLHSELGNRMRSLESNALASSIVLALRPRPDGAPTTDRRGFLAALHAELPHALRELQQGAIAPVDLPQAAIGPGMGVFSRYARVIEADGSPMTVRSALARINEILDEVLNEQEGDFDTTTRFAIAWYRQHGYGTGLFGEADNLARARNTAVETMARDGVVTSTAGKVTLYRPADLDAGYDVATDPHLSVWESLHHLIRILDASGIPAAGAFMAAARSRPVGPVDPDLVKELAFLLFSIAEKHGWAKDALAFNTLATTWPDIVATSRTSTTSSAQASFDFFGEA